MPWRTLAAFDSRSAGGVPVPALCSAFGGGAFLAATVGLRLARAARSAARSSAVRARTGLVRLARLEDAATLLPGKVVERIRLGRLRGSRGGRLLGGRGLSGLSLLGLRLLGLLGGFLGALVAHIRRVSFSTSIPR